MSNSKEKDYDTIIKERSDSFLAYVAKAAEEDMLSESEQWERELGDVKVPKDAERKILDMADNFNKLFKKEEKRMRTRKYIKAAVIVILAVTTTMTVLTVSVEAVRNRVFEFLFQENDEYMTVNTVETSGSGEQIKSPLLDHWKNFYYPGYLPDGYTLEDADNEGLPYTMTFMNADGDVLKIWQQPADQGDMIADNEKVEKSKFTINGNPAFWTSKKKETSLIWSLDGTMFMASGEVDLDTLIQLAENLIFIK
jgi:hypothetical protein